MQLVDRARDVFLAPHSTVVLDWYDGPVQAVYQHDAFGAFYLFALRMIGAEQVYCVRPLTDASVIAEAASAETHDDSNWLVRFGRERLLPACTAGEGVRLTVLRGVVVKAEAMDEAELSQAMPRLADQLLRA